MPLCSLVGGYNVSLPPPYTLKVEECAFQNTGTHLTDYMVLQLWKPQTVGSSAVYNKN